MRVSSRRGAGRELYRAFLLDCAARWVPVHPPGADATDATDSDRSRQVKNPSRLHRESIETPSRLHREPIENPSSHHAVSGLTGAALNPK